MTLTWCDFAERVDGAAGKVNPGTLYATGAVLHSAEGPEDSMISIVQSLHSGVSWHFSVMKDGRLLEHYPIEAKCWHAHAVGNEHYIGIEHEGVAGEPETDEQVGTDIRLLAWLGETLSWSGFERGVQLWEHHEVPGNATACPSGRIRWDDIIVGLQPPAPPVQRIEGIGVHYGNGSDEEIWTPREGKTLDGIGVRWTDGEIQRLWP